MALGIKLCPSEKEEEVYLVNLHLAFRQIRGGQRACVLSAPLQLLLARNNPYAKVAYFGVVYSCSLLLCPGTQDSPWHRVGME